MTQRIIKFRAWNKKEKVLLYIGLSLFEFTDSRIYELMQFTGLLDRHGKEIYEGDILHDPYNDKASNKFVCWNETCEFVLKKEKRAQTWYDLGYVDGKSFYEVIGNIWENPDLMKESRK